MRSFLFGVVDGAGKDDRSRWQKFWSKVKRLEAGEVFDFEIVFPRIGKFHRRHMKIEQAVFDAQERFTNFEQFRIWVKVGAAWVDWCAGKTAGGAKYCGPDCRQDAEREEAARKRNGGLV